MARKAVPIVEHIEERRPEATDVTPLVTLPADPSFSSVTPARFGMEWLMPSLGRLIKQAEREIIILNPFFEEDGFHQLHQPLLNALDNNIEVIIITRYLQDPDSHNRSVVEEFTYRCRERDIPLKNLTLFDYTVWDEETDMTARNQEGENPKFTLHAKLLITDQTRAYLGSANVTDYGFERYLEIGAKLDGPAVASYRELVDFLLDSDAATECHF
jgi:putative cardiolipin synthase